MNEPQNRNIPYFAYKSICSYSHEYGNFPENFDKLFKEILIEYESKFEDTMLVLMGDHGYRIGGYYNSNNGQSEHKNPFLSIKLPKSLENTEFHENMAQNKKKYKNIR